MARRTSPLTVAVAGASVVLGLAAFAFGAIVQAVAAASTSSSGSQGSRAWLLLPGAILVLTGIGRVIRWATTTYAVDGTELVVDEGVLTRDHRVLPFARVQQADTHQNLIGQILGLTELKIDVAGASGSTQVKLRLLDDATARAVRDHILRRRAELHAVETGGAAAVGADGGDAIARPGPGAGGLPSSVALGATTIGTTTGAGEVEVLRIGPARLAAGAATHSTVALAIPVVAGVGLWFAAFSITQSSNRVAGITLLVVLLGGGAIGLVAAFVTVTTVLNQYGFTVSLAGDDIHLRYGLLETRNLTVPRRRVQQVTLLDNPLRRLFGLVELHLHTAAAPGGESTTRFTIPILAAAEVDATLHTLMGSDRWPVPALTPRSAVARRRAIVRRTAVSAAVVLAPAIVLRPTGLLLLALALVGIPWGSAAHRRAGHGASDQVVAFAHGVLHHRIDLVPLDRIQSSRTRQTIFQRRVDLATILLDVAGSSRSPYLWDLDDATADGLRRDLPRRSAPVRG